MVAGDGSAGKKWKRLSERKLLDCPIFTVGELESESPDGRRGRFIRLEAPDWATVVPFLPAGEGGTGPSFLMVRQYRHGSDEASVEFPGGVVEPGEDPAAAAARELEEETGWRAGRIRSAGWTYPNPAFMGNRFHVFVADRLEPTGRRGLDEHEIVDAFFVPAVEVRELMGSGEYRHALMAAALLMADRLLPRDGAEAAASLVLEPMGEGDYAAYREACVEELARALAESRGLSPEAAAARAAAEQDEVLPSGAATSGQSLFVARLAPDGEAVGRAWFGEVPGGAEPGTAFLYYLDVAPAYRGRGLGTAILEAAEERARALGFARMRLYVLSSNAAARALYARAGYRRLRGDDRGEALAKEL